MLITNGNNLITDRDAANRFAIFSLMFMFGIRASELCKVSSFSTIDLEAKTLKIKDLGLKLHIEIV